MISDPRSFLEWFRGVHRRTVRDVGLLPPEAESWEPHVAGDDESVWGVSRLVQHLAESRPYFASAFNGRGWVWNAWPSAITSRGQWEPALAESLATFEREVAHADADSMLRRIELIGGDGRTISAWRILMMMAEHEIHHRSQIVTYASLNGWPISQLFEVDNEWVQAQRDEQLQRYRPEP